MFKCILKCEYSSCTSVHISLGPAWACGCVQTDGKSLKHDGPTTITQTGYPAYALSKKRQTENKSKQQWAQSWPGNTCATANRVWFELWNVICFHVGVTFIIHKHQMPALFNRLEDEEERLPCVRETQSHKYRKMALSKLSGRTGFLWSAGLGPRPGPE